MISKPEFDEILDIAAKELKELSSVLHTLAPSKVKNGCVSRVIRRRAWGRFEICTSLRKQY